MLEKLAAIHNRWLEIGEQMTDPETISDMKRYVKLNKDYRDLEPVVEAYKELKNVIENEASTRDMKRMKTLEKWPKKNL